MQVKYLRTSTAILTKTECPLKESRIAQNLKAFCRNIHRRITTTQSVKALCINNIQLEGNAHAYLDADTNIDVTRSPVQIIPVHLSPHGSLPTQFDGLVFQEAAIAVRPAAAGIEKQ